MGTKRTPLNRVIKARITDEVIELFRRASGRRTADALTADLELFDRLGLKPWDESPVDATEENPPARYDAAAAARWRRAWALRVAILEAAAAAKAAKAAKS
jgi:hypothetical protein